MRTVEEITEKEYEEATRHYRRIPMLFKKTKKLLMSYKKLKSFKEPAGLLIRSSMDVEFYENVKGQEFVFEHSNGKKCKILLSGGYIHNFDYGGTKFKGYLMHEDAATPIRNPLEEITGTMSSELVELALKKVWIEREKLALEGLKEQRKLWWNVFLGIAVVILAFAVYKMMTKDNSNTVTEVRTIVNATANATKGIIGTQIL